MFGSMLSVCVFVVACVCSFCVVLSSFFCDVLLLIRSCWLRVFVCVCLGLLAYLLCRVLFLCCPSVVVRCSCCVCVFFYMYLRLFGLCFDNNMCYASACV